MRAPAWLVLGEGYNRGWRAECDGRDLGAPVPLQGYANAWRVAPGCRNASFVWAPNRLLPPAYVVSLIACLVLAGVLVAGRRRRFVQRLAPAFAAHGDAVAHRWPLGRAVAAGAVAAAALGFVFALRAGVFMGPGVAVILWRGIPARTLAVAAGGLLAVVVPILYLAVPVRDPGGFNTNLAVERIAAHWVGAAAVFLAAMALWRTLALRSSRTR